MSFSPSRALNYKPVTSMGVIASLHTLAYGIAWALTFNDFVKTAIYAQVNSVSDPVTLGIIMVVGALITLYGFARQSDSGVRNGSYIQTLVWLFITALYFLNGLFLLGLTMAFIWALLHFVIAYCFNNRDKWWSGAETKLDLRTKEH